APYYAGSPLTFKLAFAQQAPLRAGGTVSLGLPDFQGGARANFAVAWAPGGASTATWAPTSHTLLLAVPADIAPDTAVEITVTTGASGLSLPASGITAASRLASFIVAADTAQGAARACVAGIRKVGTFVGTPLVALANKRAGEATGLTVTIKTTMEIDAGEVVSLRLPGFSASDAASCVPTQSTPTAAFTTASFVLASSTLVMTAGRALPAYQEIKIVAISVEGAGGSILPVTATVSGRVGTFSSSEATFVLDGDTVTEMVIECRPVMSIAAGERIAVGLAGFIPPTNGRMAVQFAPQGQLAEAAWDVAKSQVPFLLTFPVGAGALLRFALAPENQTLPLLLPPLGLTRDDNAITLSTTAAAGAVDSEPIQTSPPSGAVPFPSRPTLALRSAAGGVGLTLVVAAPLKLESSYALRQMSESTNETERYNATISEASTTEQNVTDLVNISRLVNISSMRSVVVAQDGFS
ncbi:hypothetical protein T484DRAFT_1767539, partial [Baffinella frigidus]